MKIEIGQVVLAGGNSIGEYPYDFKISNERSVQIAPTVRATAAKCYDRKNQRTTIEFRVAKRHKSADEAHAYVISHAASLNDFQGSALKITVEPSQVAYSLDSAAIAEVQSISDGIVSIHSYRIIGGNFIRN
jgi:hypothetical protein